MDALPMAEARPATTRPAPPGGASERDVTLEGSEQAVEVELQFLPTQVGTMDIVVEAVKLADDGSGDVVVRLYEARGTRARGRVVPGFGAGTATRTDLLERPWPEQPADALELDLRAFELVTLRLPRA